MSSLPTDPRDWSLDHIITHLEKKKGKAYVKDKGVHEKFNTQEINGVSFLLLNEEMLSRKPGPYEFSHGASLEIAQIIKELNQEREQGG